MIRRKHRTAKNPVINRKPVQERIESPQEDDTWNERNLTTHAATAPAREGSVSVTAIVKAAEKITQKAPLTAKDAEKRRQYVTPQKRRSEPCPFSEAPSSQLIPFNILLFI